MTSSDIRNSAGPPKLTRIAVGVDGFPEGRDGAVLAGAIARATGAEVVLVAVLSDPLVVPPTGGMSWKKLHKQAETTLAEIRDAHVPNARVVIETDFSVARAIERVARREHCDLVVVGSSPQGEIGEVRIGNRTRQLIGDAGCALAVAPRGLAEAGEPRIELIGVGYDGGPESAAALALAGAIAHAGGAELAVRAVVDDRIPTFGLHGARGSRIVAEWEGLIAGDVEELRVDDVVAAVAGVAGGGGDQVAALVVEVDRRHQVVGELQAVGAGAAGRGRREDQVVAGVDVELVPVAAAGRPGRRRPGRRRSRRVATGNRWTKPSVSGRTQSRKFLPGCRSRRCRRRSAWPLA